MKMTIILLGILLLVCSCQDDFLLEDNLDMTDISVSSRSESLSEIQEGPGETVLGAQLQNPYSVDNIATAHNMLYKQSKTFAITHYYVKLLPSTAEQMKAIDELEIGYDYEFETTPIHYEVQYEGDDGYIDPGVNESSGWAPEYGAVSYSDYHDAGVLSLIPHEIIEEMHIPEYLTHLTYVAFVISGNELYYEGTEGYCHPDCINWPACMSESALTCDPGESIESIGSLQKKSSSSDHTNFPNYLLDFGMGYEGAMDPFSSCELVINEIPSCGEGEQAVLVELEFEPGVCRWECVDIDNPGGDDLPFGRERHCDCLTYLNRKMPGGRILVEETQANEENNLRNEGVKHVKVKVTRHYWGFLWRSTDTDENGCWKIQKIFDVKRMKVKVVFRDRVTDRLRIHSWRGLRVWNAALKPVKHKWKMYKPDREWNDLCLLIFQNEEDDRKQGEAFVAATTNNSVHEYYDEFAEFPVVEDRLQILLTSLSTSAAAPMFNVMGPFEYTLSDFEVWYAQIAYYVGQATIPPSVLLALEVIWAGAKPDLLMPLKTRRRTGINLPSEDFHQLQSDAIRSVTYHELTHASQYAIAGQEWYEGIIDYIIAVSGTSQPKPYGDGTTAGSGRVEVAEAQAFSYEHIFADRRYGLWHSNGFRMIDRYINLMEPRTFWTERLAFASPAEERAYLRSLDFLPEGLIFDLYDENQIFPAGLSENESGLIVDDVSGYSLEQLMDPIADNPDSIEEYRDILFDLYGEPTTGNINDYFNLFVSYGF